MKNSNGIVKTDLKVGLKAYSKEQIKEIKNLLISTNKNTISDIEFGIFLSTSASLGLNPILKEIWCLKYSKKDAPQIFVSRDGLLRLAYETGQFNGIQVKVRTEEEPFTLKIKNGWNNQKGCWRIIEKTFPKQYVATATAWRKDLAHPIEIEVWEEEYNTGQSNWLSKRRTMISKVAEAQALRRIIGKSGVYIPEEINQEVVEEVKKENAKNNNSKIKESVNNNEELAEYDEIETEQVIPKEEKKRTKITKDEYNRLRKRFFALMKEKQILKVEDKKKLFKILSGGLESTKLIETVEDFETIIDVIKTATPNQLMEEIRNEN